MVRYPPVRCVMPDIEFSRRAYKLARMACGSPCRTMGSRRQQVSKPRFGAHAFMSVAGRLVSSARVWIAGRQALGSPPL